MSDFDFDPTEATPSTPRELIPNGWYEITIVEAEMKPTQAGPMMACLTYEIDVNKHQQMAGRARKLWDNLNVNHENQQARDIARRNLSAICAATSIKPQFVAELIGASMLVKVGVQKGKDNVMRNRVEGYKPVGEAVPTASAPAQSPAAAARPATNGATKSAGWKR